MVQERPDMTALTRAGYRITTSWSWDDVTRAMYCFETSATANAFVQCVRKRRTDALALYRYLRDVKDHRGLIYEVLPPAFESQPEEEEGEGEGETCVTFVIYDTGYFFLWVDPSQILQDALERHADMKIRYPGAYRVIPSPFDVEFSQISWRPLEVSGTDYVICTNQERADFSDAIAMYVQKLKEVMGSLE
jgi:hypothetical protein